MVMESLLLDEELLSLHQSTATPPGALLRHAKCAGGSTVACQVWGRRASEAGDRWRVALRNTGENTQAFGFSFGVLGWPTSATATVRNVWTGEAHNVTAT